jgi:hypothetical protein
LIPSSFATLAIGRDVSITIFTASSLNSGEKLFSVGATFYLSRLSILMDGLSGKFGAAQEAGVTGWLIRITTALAVAFVAAVAGAVRVIGSRTSTAGT